MTDGVDHDGIFDTASVAKEHTGNVSGKVTKYPLPVWRRQGKSLNYGLFTVRHSAATSDAFVSIARRLDEETLWDQVAFNDAMLPRGSRHGRGLSTRVLSPFLF